MSHPFLKLSFIVLVGFFISCDKPTEPTPKPEINKDFVFPIAVGNQWDYDLSESIVLVDSGTVNDPLLKDTTYFGTVNMEIDRSQIIQDSINTFVFRQSTTANDNTFITESYYNELDSGMYYYANWGGGPVLPKSDQNHKLVFNNRVFNHLSELKQYLLHPNSQFKSPVDSLNYKNPPLQYLKYPLETGSEWAYRNETPDLPFQFNKKIIAFENVTVPAGSYYCYKIQWIHDNFDNINGILHYDYISEKGLVKSSFTIKGILFTDMNGDTLGVYDIIDELVLTNTNL